MIIQGRFKASKFIVLVYQTHRELIMPSVWRPDSIQRFEHFELSVIKNAKPSQGLEKFYLPAN